MFGYLIKFGSVMYVRVVLANDLIHTKIVTRSHDCNTKRVYSFYTYILLVETID